MKPEFTDFIETTNIFLYLIRNGRKTSDRDVRINIQTYDKDPLHNYKLQEFMDEIAESVTALPGFNQILTRMLNKRDSFDGWRARYENRR